MSSDSESEGMGTGLHGNWTLENATAGLTEKGWAEGEDDLWVYSYVGPDHNRSAVHGVATPQRTVNFKECNKLLLHSEYNKLEISSSFKAGLSG